MKAHLCTLPLLAVLLVSARLARANLAVTLLRNEVYLKDLRAAD